MKKIICVILMLAAGFVSYGKQRKQKNKPVSGNGIISVAIHHGACFGRCPQYNLEVNRNGITTFTGLRFTHDSGVFTKKIGVAKAKELIDQFDVYKTDTCKDFYETRMQDVPGFTFTIKYDTKTKTIRNANFGPPILAKLRNKIDSVVEQNQELGPLLPGRWYKTKGH